MHLPLGCLQGGNRGHVVADNATPFSQVPHGGAFLHRVVYRDGPASGENKSQLCRLTVLGYVGGTGASLWWTRAWALQPSEGGRIVFSTR